MLWAKGVLNYNKTFCVKSGMERQFLEPAVL